ncbi:MAG TPA: hypothetical protein VJ972_16730 [Anaerolineales bacterium]|nr:hypothetical protein [Anaerolineales bacterium]
MKKLVYLIILLALFLPSCRFTSGGSELVENEIKNSKTPEVQISPSQTAVPLLSTSSPITDIPLDQPLQNPSPTIKLYELDKVLDSFCFYETHVIQIKDQAFTLLDYEQCLTQHPFGEYSRKKSWWDYFETLKPYYSSFTFWRYAQGEDWRPAPLEYHDYIGMEMSHVINRVYDLDGWQITKEYLEVGSDNVLCWHYHYQGGFDELPSNFIPSTDVEEKFWEEGVVNDLKADLWITLEGYVLRENIEWDVNYKLADGTIVNGSEIVSTELRNINQEVEIPLLVVPPIPSSLASGYVGKWLEIGNIDGDWKYQVGITPQDTLVVFLQYEKERYKILHLNGSSIDGYSMVIEDSMGILWNVTIEPKEGAKGGIVSVLMMVQK